MSILVHEKKRVLTLTINRQDKRNALSSEMCCQLVNAVNEAQNRNDIGAIMICAAGSVFCSGMDLAEASDPGASDLTKIHEQLFTLGSKSMKPIVVSVNGAALGGGLGLVAQGHVVMASQAAVFGLPEIHIGLWPFVIFRAVEAALGRRRTLELSLTGGLFHTNKALEWGLVHQICPPAELAERSKVTARELAKYSPLAIAAGMQYAQESRDKTWDEAGELAARLRARMMESDDFKEGIAAFKQKREPRWPSMPQEFYEQKKNSD